MRVPSTHRPARLLIALLLVAPGGVWAQEPAAHREAACSSCHGFQRRDAGLAALDCLGCHQVDVALAPAFHGRGTDCLRCHSFHDTDLIRAGARQFVHALDDPTRAWHCASCHEAGTDLDALSDGHRLAAELLYHRDGEALAGLSPSEACLRCHGLERNDLLVEQSPTELPAFMEHASHAYGIVVEPGMRVGGRRLAAVLDPRLPLPAGRLECQTCHSLSAGTEDLLIPFDDRYALCNGCHTESQAPRPHRLMEAGF